MGSSHEFDCSFLLEGFDQLRQIALFRTSSRQQVHVVRHDAISMNIEAASDGIFSEAINEPSGQARVRAEPTAVVEAKRDEIGTRATIPTGRKADVFTFEVWRTGNEFTSCGFRNGSKSCRAEVPRRYV